MRTCWIILLLAIVGTMVSAQNFTRPVRRIASTADSHRSNDTIALYDTVIPDADSIIVAGFEKPLRSIYETMFVTNATSRPVTSVTLCIDYMDMKHRQLHQAVSTVSVEIPSGETRRVEIRSFDRSRLFYYHLSPKPQRAAQATPFDVKVTVVNVTHPRLKNFEQ